MNLLNEQAQLLLAASVCLFASLLLLYLALTIYFLVIDKIIRGLVTIGAFKDYCWSVRNSNKWWISLANWREGWLAK